MVTIYVIKKNKPKKNSKQQISRRIIGASRVIKGLKINVIEAKCEQ